MGELYRSKATRRKSREEFGGGCSVWHHWVWEGRNYRKLPGRHPISTTRGRNVPLRTSQNRSPKGGPWGLEGSRWLCVWPRQHSSWVHLSSRHLWVPPSSSFLREQGLWQSPCPQEVCGFTEEIDKSQNWLVGKIKKSLVACPRKEGERLEGEGHIWVEPGELATGWWGRECALSSLLPLLGMFQLEIRDRLGVLEGKRIQQDTQYLGSTDI